jgi:SAM-dependent methyltransferase
VGDDPRRHGLRAGFDRAAEDYQRTRPICPRQLFDDLIQLTGLEAGGRVMEIGCGTGQATVPLAERGLTVTAVELGAELAAIARRRLTGFPAAEVVTCSFEDWPPPGAAFDAVVAVNSLHWIDPELRYSKPYGLLRSGGTMAVAGCLWAQAADAERFWTDVQEDYRAVEFDGSPPPPPEQIGPRHFPPESVHLPDRDDPGCGGEPERRRQRGCRRGGASPRHGRGAGSSGGRPNVAKCPGSVKATIRATPAVVQVSTCTTCAWYKPP